MTEQPHHYYSPLAELYHQLIEGEITRAVYDRRRAELEESGRSTQSPHLLRKGV